MTVWIFAVPEMTFKVSCGMLNSTHSLMNFPIWTNLVYVAEVKYLIALQQGSLDSQLTFPMYITTIK